MLHGCFWQTSKHLSILLCSFWEHSCLSGKLYIRTSTVLSNQHYSLGKIKMLYAKCWPVSAKNTKWYYYLPLPSPGSSSSASSPLLPLKMCTGFLIWPAAPLAEENQVSSPYPCLGMEKVTFGHCILCVFSDTESHLLVSYFSVKNNKCCIPKSLPLSTKCFPPFKPYKKYY